MSNRPAPEDINPPWVTEDCECDAFLHDCDFCDGDEWYFFNLETGVEISDPMRDALERHG